MNLKKKELIFSIILVVAFIIAGFNITVFATNVENGMQNIPMNMFQNMNNIQNTQIPINTTQNTSNTTEIPTNTSGTIQINNAALIKDGEVNNSTKNTNNTPTQLANTGLEDIPWVVVGICVISAIFAYKKIKEYNID